MTALLYRMNVGVQGDVSRQSQSTIESQQFNSALAFPTYGVPGKIASNLFVPIATGDVIASVYGILVRPFPSQGANASDPLGVSVPPTTGIANVLRRGWITVVCNNGTPAKGGAVYVRTAAPSGAKVIGGIEATSDGANTFIMAGATFTGAADASGNVEIEYNI